MTALAAVIGPRLVDPERRRIPADVAAGLLALPGHLQGTGAAEPSTAG